MVSYLAHCVTGSLYEYWKRVTVDKRLPGCEYGQCGVILEPSTELLVSYDMIVAEKQSDGWIRVFACPSRTTARHLSVWGKAFGLSYRRLIDMCYRRVEMNIYTGGEREIIAKEKWPDLFVGVLVKK